MKPERCSPIEELERIAALPPDDLRRRHLDHCPRCRALLKACRVFETEPVGAAEERVRDLDERLAEAVDRAIFASPVSRAVPAEGKGLSLPGRQRSGWWRSLSFGRPVVSLAAVATALILIVLGVHQARKLSLPGTEESALRGAGGMEAGALEAQARLLPGAWAFSWAQAPEADAYRLVLYDADAVEVTHFLATGSDRELRVPAESLAASAGGMRAVFWRVIAFRRGDEIVRSRLQALPLP